VTTTVLLAPAVLGSTASAQSTPTVQGSVTFRGKTTPLAAAYAFPGLDDGSGAPPPVMFVTAAPIDPKKIVKAPHAGARTVAAAELAKAKKLPLLFVWVEGPGDVRARYIEDGDLFSDSRTEWPPYASLSEVPWRVEGGRLRGKLASAGAAHVDEGLAFDVTFDVELIGAP
jgi:hypothetical protein